MKRAEFGKKVKRQASERSGLFCERQLWREGEVCRRPAKHFDHLIADGLGGEPVLSNCAHLCIPCHQEKTGTEDVPRMAAADFQRDRLVLGIKPKSRPFAKRPKPPRPIRDKLPLPKPRDLYAQER